MNATGGEIFATLILIWALFLIFKTKTTFKVTMIAIFVIIGVPIIFMIGHVFISMWMGWFGF